MLHKVAGKKLGRTKNQRRSLFRNLANELILQEKIVTTSAKAKAVKPMIEKLVTRSKENSIHNRRMLLKELVLENSVSKMLEVIGPKFKTRNGGYTKLVKLGSRVGDRAPMVALMFSEEVSTVSVPVVKEKPETESVKEKVAKAKPKASKKVTKKEKDQQTDK